MFQDYCMIILTSYVAKELSLKIIILNYNP